MYTVEDAKGSDAEKLSRMAKRLENAKANAWKRRKRKYVHSLIKCHRFNKETGTIPQVGEIVLIIGDETNRGEWRKGKVVRLIKGKDDVVRGITLLHKRHTVDRPLQLVCPLEIRAVENVDQPQKGGEIELMSKNRDQDEVQLRGLLRKSQNNCKKKRIDKLNCVQV